MDLQNLTTEVPPTQLEQANNNIDIYQAIDILTKSIKTLGVDNFEEFNNAFRFNGNRRTTSELQEAILSELRRLYSSHHSKDQHHIINNVWLVIKQLNSLINESNIEVDKTKLCLVLAGVALSNLVDRS